ncbi:MAG TPA: phosphotransferase [Tepidisphaeraceae bacterium]|jgi:homoserine kinase type II|nr:phosphotransferase [Tepidisphaeraceae bacterium]
MEHLASSMQSGEGGSGRQQALSASGVFGREQFGAEELAVVLSNYDLGVIESVTEFARGSRKAPKMLIAGEKGKFLLKRRARGRDEPQKVAFTHALQLYLTEKGFPLAHLIGTRRHNNSMLQVCGGVYELFEYVDGQPYAHTLEATHEGGKVLATYHQLLNDFRTEWKPGTGSYHAAPGVKRGFEVLLAKEASAEDREVLTFLMDSYQHASEMVEGLGLPAWPKQIVHADWHPGNMIFKGDRIAAVIDYDSARFLPRVVDVANGALQFSIVGGGDDVASWPVELDAARFRRFLRGYDSVSLLTEAEVKTLPWLMIEALVAEAVFPIAMTGHFGRVEGAPFLRMVKRKVQWMQKSVDQLIELAET